MHMKVTIYKEKIQWFFPWGLSAGSLATGIIYWLPISSKPCPGLLVHGWGRDCRRAAWFPYHTVLLDMCFDCCNGFYQLKSEMFVNSNVSLVVCFKDHRYLFPVCEFNCRCNKPSECSFASQGFIDSYYFNPKVPSLYEFPVP